VQLIIFTLLHLAEQLPLSSHPLEFRLAHLWLSVSDEGYKARMVTSLSPVRSHHLLLFLHQQSTEGLP